MQPNQVWSFSFHFLERENEEKVKEMIIIIGLMPQKIFQHIQQD